MPPHDTPTTLKNVRGAANPYDVPAFPLCRQE